MGLLLTITTTLSITNTVVASHGPHSVVTTGGLDCQVEALVGGLLFAAHPVHTEAVAGIVGQVGLHISTPGLALVWIDPDEVEATIQLILGTKVQACVLVNFCIVNTKKAVLTRMCTCQLAQDAL